MKIIKDRMFRLGFFKTFSKLSLLRLLFIPFLVLALSACAEDDDDKKDDEKEERPTKPFTLNTSLINFELVGNFYQKGAETCKYDSENRIKEIDVLNGTHNPFFVHISPARNSDESLNLICRFATGLKKLKQDHPNLNVDDEASVIDSGITDLLGGTYSYKGGNSISFGDNLVQWSADSKRVVAKWKDSNFSSILQTIFYDADKSLYVVIIENNFLKQRTYSEFWFPTDSRKYLLVKILHKKDEWLNVNQFADKDEGYVLIDEDDDHFIVTNLGFGDRPKPSPSQPAPVFLARHSKFIFSGGQTIWYQSGVGINGGNVNNVTRERGIYPTEEKFKEIFGQNLFSLEFLEGEDDTFISFRPEVKNPNGSDTASKVNTLIDDAEDFSPLRNQTYDNIGSNIADHLKTAVGNKNDPL